MLKFVWLDSITITVQTVLQSLTFCTFDLFITKYSHVHCTFLSFFLVKPENVQLTTSASNNKACQGDVISINCSADANPSVSSYQLFENDTAILNTSRSGMWSRNLTNAGVFIYKCGANNSVGSMYSTNVTVNVIVNGKQTGTKLFFQNYNFFNINFLIMKLKWHYFNIAGYMLITNNI